MLLHNPAQRVRFLLVHSFLNNYAYAAASFLDLELSNILYFLDSSETGQAHTYPLSRLAKMFMMLEAVLSLAIVGILIASAVNIL